MSHGEDLQKALQMEREKLDEIVAGAPNGIQEVGAIVDAYHQAISVSSILGALNLVQDDVKPWSGDMSRAKETLLKFNTKVHPNTLAGLVDSIAKMSHDLQANDTERSREEIEDRSTAYEKLRQKMSTREFVEQYGVELSSSR